MKRNNKLSNITKSGALSATKRCQVFTENEFLAQFAIMSLQKTSFLPQFAIERGFWFQCFIHQRHET